MKYLQYKKAFTLIELLIVIAIIGILAVGILAAINPIEQNRRANDAKFKNAISELHGAFARYYSQNSMEPWCTGSSSCRTPISTAASPVAVSAAQDNAGTPVNILTKMQNAGEITSNFQTATSTQLATLYITTTNTSATLCFQPTSASLKSDANTKYTNADGSGACTVAYNSSCYYCVTQ